LAKRLSEEQKKQIAKYFLEGKTLDELASEFDFTKLTISRNLKKYLGDKKFKELNIKDKSENIIINREKKEKYIGYEGNNKNTLDQKNTAENYKDEYFSPSSFMELTPLDYEIDNLPQKDLSSVSIFDVYFPNTLYMVVDKKIELEVKYLRDYPDWQFLSQDELNRKTIEIYEDLKKAKRFCNKEQKVIKIPNTNVFKIVAPILVSRGISRIVSSDKLIAL